MTNIRWLLVPALALAAFLPVSGARAEIVVQTEKPVKLVAWQHTPTFTFTEYGLDQTQLSAIVAQNSKGIKSMTVLITDGFARRSLNIDAKPTGLKFRPYPTQMIFSLQTRGLFAAPDHPTTIDSRRPLLVNVRLLLTDGGIEAATYTFLALGAALTGTPSGLAASASNAATVYLFAQTAGNTTQLEENSVNGAPFSDTLGITGSAVTYYLFAAGPHGPTPAVNGSCPPDDPLLICRSATPNGGSTSAPTAPTGSFYLSPLTFQFDNSTKRLPEAGFIATGEWSGDTITTTPTAGTMTHFIFYMPTASIEMSPTQYVPDGLLNPGLMATVGPLSYGKWTISVTSEGGSANCSASYEKGFATNANAAVGDPSCK